MQRRTFLRSAGAGGLAFTGLSSRVSASSPSTVDPRELPQGFFRPIESISQTEGDQFVVQCAGALCAEEYLPTEETGEIGDDVGSLNHHIRRVRFGIRTLNEYNITTAIDESMVLEIENSMRDKTRYIPLIGSFNNLQGAACELSQNPAEKNVRGFIFAAMAFGLEVGMWQMQVPYKMAWNGTRFVSNRTFLRYAQGGCRGCIALVMSEIHWALRALPYSISELEEDFVYAEIQRLDEEAEKLGKAVDSIDLDKQEVINIVERTDDIFGVAALDGGNVRNDITGSPVLVGTGLVFLGWIAYKYL